jgi:hypothetical protein
VLGRVAFDNRPLRELLVEANLSESWG